jgi:hypothetical protein
MVQLVLVCTMNGILGCANAGIINKNAPTIGQGYCIIIQ